MDADHAEHAEHDADGGGDRDDEATARDAATSADGASADEPRGDGGAAPTAPADELDETALVESARARKSAASFAPRARVQLARRRLQ